jgi:VIT1/CCC1 family predicted Fe2+/Mn2+ transporter
MTGERTKRVLDTSERTAEVLFGLIMVLTFTGSLSVAEAGRADVRVMLFGALGCNLAWGIIDGVLYLMGTLAENNRRLDVYRGVRQTRDPADARALIAAAAPAIALFLQPEDLERMRLRVHELPRPARVRVSAADWRGALAVCLLVFLSTFPVAMPFMFMPDAVEALRVSNVVAVLMLFALGASYGRCVHLSPGVVGFSMVLLGAALVALTMALGG